MGTHSRAVTIGAGLAAVPLALVVSAGPAGASAGGHSTNSPASAAAAGGSSQSGPSATGSAPAGNNGTIKIDEAPIDAGRDNDPHVGCAFNLELFGFDGGQNTAQVTFSGQAPTGGGTLLTDSFSFGGQGRSQGGATFDTARPYDLAGALTGMSPAAQGFHVKVSVSVDGQPAKHKVFWVQSCAPSAATAPAATNSATNGGLTTVSGIEQTKASPAISSASSAAALAAESSQAQAAIAGNSAQAAPAGTQVLGESLVRSGQPAAVAGLSLARPAATGSLPFTGTNALELALAGLTAISAGLALVLYGRHRRDLLAEQD